MSLSTALVTYLSRAFRTLTCLFIGIGTHNYRAFWVGTPLQQWTFLYLQISEEETVLIEGGEVCEIFDDIRLQRDATVRAGNLLNPQIVDLLKA